MQQLVQVWAGWAHGGARCLLVPALCRQLLAAPPLPTCHSTGAPKLTSQRGGELAGRAGRGHGRGRAGVAARRRSTARPPQRPEPRGAAGHPRSAPGMWPVCVFRPGAGPPRRTQPSWAAGGLRGSVARPTLIAAERRPAAWRHRSPGLAGVYPGRQLAVPWCGQATAAAPPVPLGPRPLVPPVPTPSLHVAP